MQPDRSIRTAARGLCLALVLTLLCGAVGAAQVDITEESVCCLSADSFAPAGELTGIYVSAVPAANLCGVYLGQRRICAGDVLPAEALGQLTVAPVTGRQAETALFYRPISEGELGLAQELKFSLLGGKNTAPVAADGELETYKNIENTGCLTVTDAEGDKLTYTLVKEPKRGTVVIREDGTFTYTPAENKVGKDKFVFTATDSAGNVSNEACIKVRILKPTDKATYTDVSADQAYTAMRLKELEVYAGRTVDGNLCFCPDETVSRGEFLIMAMALFDREPEQAMLTSGFADEGQTPRWMRPYILSAFRDGVISGSSTEAGLVFRPSDTLTHAEAAVMVQGILDLPLPESQTVFAPNADGSAVPAWAREAASALGYAGVAAISAQNAQTPVSRYEACTMLLRAYDLAGARELESQ